ncbi:hypothetical protein [Paractinoplanes rhizophilus]|uniref:hypothetical protein n=1 Tax=Paractinoplanes rhizophilus TaxID=1416877 RepID=UPI003672B95C
MADLTPYSKKLVLPAGFDAPRRLEFDDVIAHAIGRDDLADDVRGINRSLEIIRKSFTFVLEATPTSGSRSEAGPQPRRRTISVIQVGAYGEVQLGGVG